MVETDRPTVGMLHQLPETDSVVVGRQVAATELLRACGELSQTHDYQVYCPTRELEPLQQQLGAAARLELRDRRQLTPGASLPTVWHDSQFDTFTPFALRAKLGGSYPISVVHHTLSYQELLHDRILRLLLAQPRSTDALVCTSQAAERALRNLVNHVADHLNEAHGTKLAFPGRFVRIPFGVDTGRFRALERGESRAHFDLEDDAFVMLWVGRLSIVDKADLLPLVQAVADLAADNPSRPLRLLCAGGQRPGERFGDVVADYARQLGVAEGVVRVVAPEDESVRPWRPMLYSSADVFVSPADNLQESFGLTPVEAMACGVPQVAADWNGYRDTVQHGETGFLVPTHWGAGCDDVSAQALQSDSASDHLTLAQSVVVDMGALRGFVQQLIDEPDLRRRMGEASRRRAEQVYSWSAVVAQYEELWMELGAHAPAEPPLDGNRYAAPDYGAVFEHYASAPWDEERELVLTARGERLVQGQQAELPAHYNTGWKYLDVALLQRILAGFAHMRGREQALSMKRVVAVIAKGDGSPLTQARVRRHVMWLMKYDLVGPR